MTQAEFRGLIPYQISHRSSGAGELEILIDVPGKKGACYRHRDNTASFGTYGSTWLEVYEELSKRLALEEYSK